MDEEDLAEMKGARKLDVGEGYRGAGEGEGRDLGGFAGLGEEGR